MSALKHISSKTKILFFAILLILLPSAVLSYLGFQSIQEKADNLTTNYRVTINLVREKLEREVIRLEEALRSSLKKLPTQLPKAEDLKSWLRSLESGHPWLKQPFLLSTEGAVLSTSVSLGWSKGVASSGMNWASAEGDFSAAEEAEFVKKDLAEAVRLYKSALGNAAAPEKRGLLLSRIGRCYFKMEKQREGIKEYEKILAVPTNPLHVDGIPYSIMAGACLNRFNSWMTEMRRFSSSCNVMSISFGF